MLTPDLIDAALTALERGELPSPMARLTLCSSVRRALAGLSWQAASGESGTLRLVERNQALRALAVELGDIDQSVWATAGRVHQALHRPPPARGRPALLEALQDARRRGADELGRDMIYRILSRSGFVRVADSGCCGAD